MGKNFFDKYFSKAGVALIYNLCAAAAILSCPTVFGSGSTERGATAAAAMEVKSEKPTGGALVGRARIKEEEDRAYVSEENKRG